MSVMSPNDYDHGSPIADGPADASVKRGRGRPRVRYRGEGEGLVLSGQRLPRVQYRAGEGEGVRSGSCQAGPRPPKCMVQGGGQGRVMRGWFQAGPSRPGVRRRAGEGGSWGPASVKRNEQGIELPFHALCSVASSISSVSLWPTLPCPALIPSPSPSPRGPPRRQRPHPRHLRPRPVNHLAILITRSGEAGPARCVAVRVSAQGMPYKCKVG